jgi:hypothetical protein
VLESPWDDDDYFYGTSGKSFAPNQQVIQNISIYVPNLQRYGSGDMSSSYPITRYGYSVNIYYLGEYIFQTMYQRPFNYRYYQKYFAVFNETSVVGFPFFMTKHHFMNCSSNWTSFIDVWNEKGDTKFEDTSHWDDSFVIVEVPFSDIGSRTQAWRSSRPYSCRPTTCTSPTNS